MYYQNKSVNIVNKNSKSVVSLYFLLSILIKENRLFFMKASIISILVTCLYYASVVLLFLHILAKEGKIVIRKDIVRCIRIFFPLLFLYLCCELIAVNFNSSYSLLYGSANINHFLTLFIKYIIMIPAIFMMYDLRREKTIETIVDVLIINEIIIIFSNYIEYGFIRTTKDLFSFITSFSTTSESVFEFDGPTYCCGIILLFYLFNKNHKLPKWKLVFLLFSFFVGRKRIAIFALIFALLLKVVLLNKRIDKKKTIIFSLILSSGMLVYLSLLYNNTFFDIMDDLGIGLSGRGLLYKYFIKQSELSIFQLPWGIGSIEMIFANASYTIFANNFIASAIHNDILRLYIEFGFIGFVIWLIIMTYYFPRMINKYIGEDCAKLFIICTVYCFINYMVSNTFFYSPLFTLLILVPLSARKEEDSTI